MRSNVLTRDAKEDRQRLASRLFGPRHSTVSAPRQTPAFPGKPHVLRCRNLATSAIFQRQHSVTQHHHCHSAQHGRMEGKGALARERPTARLPSPEAPSVRNVSATTNTTSSGGPLPWRELRCDFSRRGTKWDIGGKGGRKVGCGMYHRESRVREAPRLPWAALLSSRFHPPRNTCPARMVPLLES